MCYKTTKYCAVCETAEVLSIPCDDPNNPAFCAPRSTSKIDTFQWHPGCTGPKPRKPQTPPQDRIPRQQETDEAEEGNHISVQQMDDPHRTRLVGVNVHDWVKMPSPGQNLKSAVERRKPTTIEEDMDRIYSRAEREERRIVEDMDRIYNRAERREREVEEEMDRIYSRAFKEEGEWGA